MPTGVYERTQATRKITSEAAKGNSNGVKHGMHGTATYISWRHMRHRCLSPKSNKWDYYGGRGITICERWSTFENFYLDMGERPKGKTLDRIDNDGNYCPENCKWSTAEEQVNNRRNTVILELNGKSMTIPQWAKHLGINKKTLATRMYSGMSTKDILEKPVSFLSIKRLNKLKEKNSAKKGDK